MHRRDLLQLGLLGSASALLPAAASAAGSAAIPAFKWPEATVRGLRDAMAKGSVTSRGLCEAYLARIDALNLKGPELRAILELNPDALAIADALDKEQKEKGPRGPLHGIPVVLKDNLDTGDKMQTTAGSLALLGTPAKRDAFVVGRLRDAGAVILAKANLSEWANIRSTRSTSGWSARGGQARNPYALDRSPLGSSSGSAIAVAADLCAVAIGTETDGSVLAPSSVNAIVGMKPTVGLVSRSGIIPISESQDTAGPMARTVEDCALLLNAICAVDPEDAATRVSGRKQAVDYAAGLDPAALNGARLGVVRPLFGKNPFVNALIEKQLSRLTELGAVLVDPISEASHVIDVPTAELNDPELEVLLFELKDGLAKYLEKRRPDAKVKSLADVIAFNLANAEKEMPYFNQELFEKAVAKGPLSTPAYVKARDGNRKKARGAIDALIAKHKLDALIAPTMDPAWLIDPVLGDLGTASGYSLAAVAGYPSLTVPAGMVLGLPVGLMFFGAAWSEARLLQLGFAYEQATKHRVPPTFAASVTPRPT
jgi:amidase